MPVVMQSAVVGDSHVRTWPGVPSEESQPKLRPVYRFPVSVGPEGRNVREHADCLKGQNRY